MKKIILIIAIISVSFIVTESKSQVRMNVQVGIGRPVYGGYISHRRYIGHVRPIVPVVEIGYPVNYGYGYAPRVAYCRPNYYIASRQEYRHEGRRERGRYYR